LVLPIVCFALLALARVPNAFAAEAPPDGDSFQAYDASQSSAGTSRGMTDDSPLATHRDKPDESLCERAEEGHRRATTFGNELLVQSASVTRSGGASSQKTARELLKKAEACFLAALRHKRDFPMALYGLGEVHSKRPESYALAVRAYALATQTWPQYVDAYVALGDLYLSRKKLKKAERAYRSGVEASSADPLAWEALGRFYLDDAVKRFARAGATYRRAALAVKDGGSSPGLLLGLAEASKGAERFQECVSQSEKAVSAAPNFARALDVAGTCRLSLGDAAGAVSRFRDAVRSDPETAAHYQHLAAALVKSGRTERALQALEEGVAFFSGSQKVRGADAAESESTLRREAEALRKHIGTPRETETDTDSASEL